jgi:hypothetical protein
VAFKLSKQQLAERDALVAARRGPAAVSNVAVAVYNQAIEQMCKR